MPSIRAPDLNLDYTLFSGQVFDWAKRSDCSYYGSVYGDCANLFFDYRDERLYFDGVNSSQVRKFFDLTFDYKQMALELSKDPVLSPDLSAFYGIRILRQDPWECAVTFLVSQNNNMDRIRSSLEKIRRQGGQDGGKYSFPSPREMAGLAVSDYVKMGLGYRAPYIKKLAQNVVEGVIEFRTLERKSYPAAKAELVEKQLGIGPKVADCVLLYSLGKLEAAPVDVWIKKAVLRRYAKEIENYAKETNSKSRMPGEQLIGDFLRRRFGKFAGYAQLFLFLSERSQFATIKSW